MCPRRTTRPRNLTPMEQDRPVPPRLTCEKTPRTCQNQEPRMSDIPQERRVVTAIPGPKSQELQARRVAAVAAGVGSTLPVFTARVDRGIIEDVDGNRLIDFGSGIAV